MSKLTVSIRIVCIKLFQLTYEYIAKLVTYETKYSLTVDSETRCYPAIGCYSIKHILLL